LRLLSAHARLLPLADHRPAPPLEPIDRHLIEACMNLSTTQLRLLGSLMYFAAAALILNFFAQFTIQVWPFKFGELNWRVGAAGLVMDALLSTVMPQVILYAAAVMNNDRKLLQIMRWISMLVGVAIIALMLLFLLDSVQIRAQLPQNVKVNFMKVALRAGLVGVLLSMLFIWLGFSMGKVLKSQGTVRTPGMKDPAAENMLMVGTREPSRPTLRSIDATDGKKDAKKEGTGGLSIDI
jgi:small-conductance mechanosensitive channel